MATDRFIDSISANLRYWCEKVDTLSNPAMHTLRPEQENMRRAIAYGLELPAVWKQAAELLLSLDFFIDQSGNCLAWQHQLQRALALCPDSELSLKARLYDLSGRCYRHDRNLQASLAAHHEEGALVRTFGFDDLLPQWHLNMSTVYWRKRGYGQAQNHGEQALAGFLEVNASERKLGGAYTVLGLVEYGRGRFAKAIPAFEQAVNCFRRSSLTILQARCLVNLALAQGADGQSDAAIETYGQARSLLDDSEYEMEKSRLELSFGALLFNLGQFEKAEEAFCRANSPYLKRSGLIYFQALVANNLGNAYLEQGRLGEAESILHDSLLLWDRANANLQKLNSTGTLAKTLAAQGRSTEALSYFETAIEGLNALPEDGWARELLDEFVSARDALVVVDKKTGQIDV